MPTLRMLMTAIALTAAAMTTMTAVAPTSASIATNAGARAKAKAKAACRRAKSRTVAANGLVRVFTRPGDDGYNEGTDLLACWRKTGRARSLFFAYSDDYVTSEWFELVRLRGRFVAFYSESFDIGCKADCPPGYEATHRSVNVVDARFGTGWRTRLAERPAGNRLLLDARGAIAWPQWLPGNQIEVRVRDGGGQRVVDSGAIHPESLALTPGGRLTWVNDATGHSMQLARAKP